MSSDVPVRIPTKAILRILDLIHTMRDEYNINEVSREAANAVFEFAKGVDTMALAVMAEEHGELEIRPRG